MIFVEAIETHLSPDRETARAQAVNVASAKKIGAARDMLGIIQSARDMLRRENEKEPVISDTIPDDIRFKLGAAWALSEVLGIPDACNKLNTRKDETEGTDE